MRPFHVLFVFCFLTSNWLQAQGLAEAEINEAIVDELIEERAPGEEPYWRALILFDLGQENWAEAREYLERAAALDFSPAMNLLGSCYMGGEYGYRQEPRKGHNWFNAAAEIGDGFAAANLSESFYNGWGCRRSLKRAEYWAQRAVSHEVEYYQGFPSEGLLKELDEQDISKIESIRSTISSGFEDPVKRARTAAWAILGFVAKDEGDDERAAESFIKACDLANNGQSGQAPAAIEAALAYAMGKGVERNMQKANELLELSRSMSESRVANMASNLFQERVIDQLDVGDFRKNADRELDQAQSMMQVGIGSLFADEDSEEFDPRQAVKWYELAAERGDPGAQMALAHLYLERDYSTYDPEKARHWFERMREEHEYHIAAVNYAICLLEGIGGGADREKAMKILKEVEDEDFSAHLILRGQGPRVPLTVEGVLELDKDWARKNDPHAQYVMGIRYQMGAGVEQSIKKARGYFEDAMKQGHPGAMVRLAQIAYHQDKSTSRARELLQRARSKGYADATFQLAVLRSNTEGEESIFEVIALYEDYLKLKPDSEGGKNNLAVSLEKLLKTNYFKGDPEGREKTIDRLLALYSEASEEGDPYGDFNLGTLYYEGELVEQDYRKALLYFEKATDNEHEVAPYFLGEMYRKGEGVGADHETAAYYYRLCAGAWNPGRDNLESSLTYLIESHLNGRSAVRNPDRLVFWVIRLLSIEESWAFEIYGDHLLERGEYREAINLFKGLRYSSFKNGYTSRIRGYAYARLGKCYDEGLGVPRNPEKAEIFYSWAIHYGNPDGFYWASRQLLDSGSREKGMRYLEFAADEGSPSACYQLASRLLAGGDDESVVKGMRYLKKAAALHHPEAILQLARTRVMELPSAPDLREAIQLASQAENLGLEDAQRVLTQLEAILDVEESKGEGSSFEQRFG